MGQHSHIDYLRQGRSLPIYSYIHRGVPLSNSPLVYTSRKRKLPAGKEKYALISAAK
jgi:hypothetical protein